MTTFDGCIIDVEAGDSTRHVYGVAFDIGTTSVVGSLMDLTSGEQLAATGSVNPQAVYGGDLMSRIAYAQFDYKRLTTLRAKVLPGHQRIRQGCLQRGRSLACPRLQDRHRGQHVHAPRLPRHRHELRGARPVRSGGAPVAGPARAGYPAQERAPRTGLLPADRRRFRRCRHHGLHARDQGSRERGDQGLRGHRDQRRSGHGKQGSADGMLGAGGTCAGGRPDPARHARRARSHREGKCDRRRRLSCHRKRAPDRHLRVGSDRRLRRHARLGRPGTVGGPALRQAGLAAGVVDGSNVEDREQGTVRPRACGRNRQGRRNLGYPERHPSASARKRGDILGESSC